MKTAWLLMVLAGMAFPGCAPKSHSSASPAAELAHVSNSFDFVVHGPVSTVTPLFAPLAERGWAEGWDPHFLYPQPESDQPGAVFTVKHGSHLSTWVTTALDLGRGHIQYVYVIPDAQVTLIDIRVSSTAAGDSHVHVTYERTALVLELNDHVKELGNSDRQSAAHWQTAIDNYLERTAESRKNQSK